MSYEEAKKLLAEAKINLEKFNEAKKELMFLMEKIHDNAITRLESLPKDYDFPEGGEDPDELDRVAEEASRILEDLDNIEFNLEDLVAEKFPYEKEEK
jgi:hypothetical protein